jgi:phage antirepressor YoqD-like protein
MSNLTTCPTTTVTMTSKEMAILTETRHDSVKRTVDTLAEKGVISYPQIVDGEKAANGVVEKLYRIGKRDSYIIVAQLSPEFTARLVDRWQELEAQPVFKLPDFNNPILAARAWADQAEKVQALSIEAAQQQQRLEASQPKAEALDRIAKADGSFCIRDAAKTLQVQEKALKQTLIERQWMYRRPMGSGFLAYSDKLQQGLLEHKITRGEKGDGSEWVGTQARITAKGMTRLAQDLGS